MPHSVPLTPNRRALSGLMLSSTMKTLIRCAGLSAILSLCISVYGAHSMKDNNSDGLQRLFQLAQIYHSFHSVALLALPLVSRPVITGLLLMSGLTLFCGPIYYHAIQKDPQFRRLTPYGGILLIAGWLSVAILE